MNHTEGLLCIAQDSISWHTGENREESKMTEEVGIFLPVKWLRGLRPIGPDENPKARLLGQVNIGGVYHHMEAIEVVRSEDEGWRSVLPDEDTCFEAVQIGSGEGVLNTVEIPGFPGRQYVLLVTPGTE